MAWRVCSASSNGYYCPGSGTNALVGDLAAECPSLPAAFGELSIATSPHLAELSSSAGHASGSSTVAPSSKMRTVASSKPAVLHHTLALGWGQGVKEAARLMRSKSEPARRVLEIHFTRRIVIVNPHCRATQPHPYCTTKLTAGLSAGLSALGWYSNYRAW